MDLSKSLTHALINPGLYTGSLNVQERYSMFRSQAQLLEQMGEILLEFYYCEGPVFLLNAVVELSQAHMDLVAVCDKSKISAAIAQVGHVSLAVYELSHDLGALQYSIKAYECLLDRHLSLTPPDSHCSYIRARLAYALLYRFKDIYQGDDYRMALKLLEAAHHDIPDNLSRAWITIVAALVKSESDGWSVTSITLEDLQATLDDLRHSRKGTSPRSLCILSLIAECRMAMSIVFNTNQREHVPVVIETARLGLRMCTRSAEVLRFQYLICLSLLYLACRSLVKNSVQIIACMDSAIELSTEAQSLTALMEQNIYKRWYSLQHKALCHMLRATYSENLDAMEEAIDAFKEAFQIIKCCNMGFQQDYKRDQTLNNLIYCLNLHFERTGSIGVLEEILSLRFEPTGTLVVPKFASNIARALLFRAQVADVGSAKSLINEAIRICQARKDFPDFAKVLSSEAYVTDQILIAASRMQIRVGDRPYLEPQSMLQMAQRLLFIMASQDTGERVELVLAQVDAVICQARKENDVSLLALGLSLVDQELSLQVTASSVFAADLFAARADILFARSGFNDTDCSYAMDRAWDQYECAANATSGRPSQRFQSCLRWAGHASERGSMTIALRAYSHAIEILPRVVFLGERVIERIEALRQVNGLASSAVAAALTLGNVLTAIDFLERTRGILWLQSSRVQDSELWSLPNGLRDRFSDVSRGLTHADSLHWSARRRKAEEFAQTVAEIRACSGFERFQLPPLLHDIQLTMRASGSYAVVIVPSTSCCNVVILGMNAPQSDACHLRLPRITATGIRDLCQRYVAACSLARTVQDNTIGSRKISKAPEVSSRSRQDAIASLLAELWSTVVYPILQYMGAQCTPDYDSRQRLWWCPVGPLCSLPLHAAGLYTGPSQDHVGNYVISSYTPTLSVLYRLLKNTPKSKHVLPTPTMLLVAQSTSIGMASLANVRTEIREVKGLIAPHCVTNFNCDPSMTVNDALDGFKEAHMVHLACHGHQDQANPMNSGFELKDGRLTLEKLMHVEASQAQLAYLSACDSAGIDESRPDEGLNLAGTMIFVGFKSVIGTMWAMDDVDGPFMARLIYSRIFQEGKLDLGAVPYAVDAAVRQLRESGVPASRWATYVHFGV